MKKFIIGALLGLGVLFTTPVFAQDADPSCTTSQEIQDIVVAGGNVYTFVKSMTDEEIATVEKNVSAEYGKPIDLGHVDIYQKTGDVNDLRIVIFSEAGCYLFDFPDTLEHTLKLLEEDHL